MTTNGNGSKPAYIKPRDYRHDCGRLLFRGILAAGTHIEIRCAKCGRMWVWPAPVVIAVEQTATAEAR